MTLIDTLSEDMKTGIKICTACRDECETVLFQHCLKVDGRHTEEKHVKLMTDCIEICQTAANFMLRGSDMHVETCRACAEICEACANSCDDIGGAEMSHCADTCRRCAATCRDMSAQSPATVLKNSEINSGITL